MRVVVGAGVATVAFVVAFVISYGRIERYQRISEQLVAFSRHASGLHTLQWQVLAERDLSDEFTERVRQARLRFLNARRLVNEDPHDPFLSTLTEAYDTYVTSVDRVLLLIAIGDLEHATLEEQSVVEHAYANLDRVVTRAERSTRARELRNLRLVQAGSFGVLFLGALATVAASFRLFSSLERSAERLRALSEHSSDLLWIVEPSGHILYSTPSVTQVLAAVGTSEGSGTLWDTVHPDDL